MGSSSATSVDLYWIPLGAGGHCVRFNGRLYEALVAARKRRRRCPLYHAALIMEADGDRYAVEIAPSPDADEASRGVVGTGAVGSRHLGRLRRFRYEVRCWRGGSIPDLAYAVSGPRLISADAGVARRLVELVPVAPRPVWGRDELHAGEMWNSNSMIAWLIATAGLPTAGLRPPAGGRAPGWDAGLRVAARDRDREEHAGGGAPRRAVRRSPPGLTRAVGQDSTAPGRSAAARGFEPAAGVDLPEQCAARSRQRSRPPA